MRLEESFVNFGSATIRFEVEYRPRKHIGITVRPDLRVLVAVPEGTPIALVRDRVKKRAPWILRQLDYFERFRPLPTPRQYLSGETFYYLGRQYRMKLVQGGGQSVKLLGRYLQVDCTNTSDTAQVQRLVDAWYGLHARSTFERRMDTRLKKHPGLADSTPPITIRRMKSRWGSCTKAGRIMLNTELIQAPTECIDYVIVHELCHLKVPDHSLKFFRLLTRNMPDWRRRKDRLESLRVALR